MNKKISIIALAVSGLMAVSTLASAGPKCSLKTLKGTYIFHLTGTRGGVPYAESGQEIYDGNGNITSIFTDNTGEEVRSTATYTMNANCTGKTSYDIGESYAIYASPDGTQLTYVEISINPGTVGSGIERRVSTSAFK